MLVEGGGATARPPAGDVCGQHPYFKPAIDGRGDDWQDAIPVAFTSGAGRRSSRRSGTAASSRCWWRSRKTNWSPTAARGREAACDAVQFALRPLEPPEDERAQTQAGRFEFLLVPLPEDKARCFQLAAWDTPCQTAAQVRPLEALAYDDAEVVVRREGETTYYECSLPWRPMSDLLRPSEGREFFFSVLVHDAQGTGLRDLGTAARCGPRNRMPAIGPPGIPSPADAPQPLGNRIRWGMCTSKY